MSIRIHGNRRKNVMIRMFDDIAIIHGGTTDTTAAGRRGAWALHRRLAKAGRNVAHHLSARHARLTRRDAWAIFADQRRPKIRSQNVQSNL
jgi:hypothetical protein